MYFVIVLLVLLACNETAPQRKFDRELELKNYLTNRKISFPAKEGYVFLINNKNCNSCILDLISEVFQKFESNNKPKLFVLTKSDSAFAQQIISLKNVHAIVADSLNELQKYGLDYGDDLLLELKDGSVVDWTEISSKNLPKIHKLAETR